MNVKIDQESIGRKMAKTEGGVVVGAANEENSGVTSHMDGCISNAQDFSKVLEVAVNGPPKPRELSQGCARVFLQDAFEACKSRVAQDEGFSMHRAGVLEL